MNDNNENGNDNNSILIRRRVGEFLSNEQLNIPPSLNISDATTIAFLRANTGESLDSILALIGHKYWYTVTGSTVTTLILGRDLDRTIPNSWQLSQKIGNMVGLEKLVLCNCLFIPLEIAKLTSLNSLELWNYDGQIDFPPVEILSLTLLSIRGGTWNRTQISVLLDWVATYLPRLQSLCFFQLPRETTKLFVEELKEFDLSNLINLRRLQIQNCGLIEDDARNIIFNLLPLHPEIISLHLLDNDIACLQTIGDTANSIKCSMLSKLLCINLSGNPCFPNLESPESVDHTAVISLLKNFNNLVCLGYSKDSKIQPTSEIEYRAKLNRGGRFLVEGGSGVDRKMLPLNLWANVLERGYRTSNGGPHAFTLLGEDDPTHDATAIYHLIRKGPIFSDRRIVSAASSPKTSKHVTNYTVARKRKANNDGYNDINYDNMRHKEERRNSYKRNKIDRKDGYCQYHSGDDKCDGYQLIQYGTFPDQAAITVEDHNTRSRFGSRRGDGDGISRSHNSYSGGRSYDQRRSAGGGTHFYQHDRYISPPRHPPVNHYNQKQYYHDSRMQARQASTSGAPYYDRNHYDRFEQYHNRNNNKNDNRCRRRL